MDGAGKHAVVQGTTAETSIIAAERSQPSSSLFFVFDLNPNTITKKKILWNTVVKHGSASTYEAFFMQSTENTYVQDFRECPELDKRMIPDSVRSRSGNKNIIQITSLILIRGGKKSWFRIKFENQEKNDLKLAFLPVAMVI